jgi:hypothetical protein
VVAGHGTLLKMPSRSTNDLKMFFFRDDGDLAIAVHNFGKEITALCWTIRTLCLALRYNIYRQIPTRKSTRNDECNGAKDQKEKCKILILES